MGHYIYKSIPDAKFEVDSSFSFGDMTSQSFPQKRERVIRFDCLPPENWFNFKKTSFYVQNRSSRPNIDPPMSISTIFKQRKIFSFSKFLGRLDDERAAATPLIDQFC